MVDVAQRELPARYWVELVLAVVGGLLFLLTLITREWIEILTGWDPDGGNGTLELALAIGLLVIAAVSALLARRDYVAATAA